MGRLGVWEGRHAVEERRLAGRPTVGLPFGLPCWRALLSEPLFHRLHRRPAEDTPRRVDAEGQDVAWLGRAGAQLRALHASSDWQGTSSLESRRGFEPAKPVAAGEVREGFNNSAESRTSAVASTIQSEPPQP